MKHDSELTFAEYWQKHRLNIANWRNWQCYAEDCPARKAGRCTKDCSCPNTRENNCSTLKAVDRLVSRLDELLPDKPIADLSLLDIKHAISRLQELDSAAGNAFAQNTVRTFYSYIHDITRYAEAHGHASDVLRTVTQDEVTKILCAQNKGERESIIEEYLEKLMKLPRSLSFWQIERLLLLVSERLLKDGRCCAILLALFCGLRPAEIRFLRWRDLRRFASHPMRRLAMIYNSRDGKGRKKDRVKSANGFRKIPIHFELESLLNQRFAYVVEKCRQSGAEEGAWLDYPICCLGNDFNAPCRDYQLSNFLKPFFKKIRLSLADLVPYLVDQLAEDTELSGDDDQILELYVLRRTFWTLLNSCTQLSDFEKRYVMGHKIEVDRKDQRGAFNDEDKLWRICQKMDFCIYSQELHAKMLKVSLTGSSHLTIDNRGVLYLHIPQELLALGGELSLDIITEECGDEVSLQICNSPRLYDRLTLKYETSPFPAPPAYQSGINCERDIWEAHLGRKQPVPKQEKEDAEITSATEIASEAEKKDDAVKASGYEKTSVQRTPKLRRRQRIGQLARKHRRGARLPSRMRSPAHGKISYR